jgi:hypothetical protein
MFGRGDKKMPNGKPSIPAPGAALSTISGIITHRKIVPSDAGRRREVLNLAQGFSN